MLPISGRRSALLQVLGMPEPSARRSTDYWNCRRHSKAHGIVVAACWVASFGVLAWFTNYAQSAGMPMPALGLTTPVWFLIVLMLNSAIHEAGHITVAWALGYRIRSASVGPFTFKGGSGGVETKLDFARLFGSGGCAATMQSKDEGVRANEIAILAAGPMANAISALIFLTIFFAVVGTPWQGFWWLPALASALAVFVAAGNLIPPGYCDGIRLFHLITWTPAGRLLVDEKRAQKFKEAAEVCRGRADFEGEIERLRDMLALALSHGERNAFTIASCYEALGKAHADLGDWPGAEFHYEKALAFDAELSTEPVLAANVWSGLQRTRSHRYHAADAATAYAACVKTREILEQEDTESPVFGLALLGEAQANSHEYRAALKTIDEALKELPADRAGVSMRVRLLRNKAACHLHLHDFDAGLAAAQFAAALLRSPAFPMARRNLAFAELADLGYRLWLGGQGSVAIELMREGIGQLESAGAIVAAAHYEIKLAGVLCEMNRTAEAEEILPDEDQLGGSPSAALLEQRARIHLRAGRFQAAMVDCAALMEHWARHPYDASTEAAAAQALLAEASLGAGRPQEAERLALQAEEVLDPYQHPAAADCLLTAGLARLQNDRESAMSLAEEAFRRIDSNPLLSRVDKARWQEDGTARIQQALRGDRAIV